MSAQSLTQLDALVSQVPEPMRPVMQHVAGMLRSSMVAFDSHVADNVQSFLDVESNASRAAARLSTLELRAERVSADGDNLTSRVTALEASSADLTTRADSVAADGAKAVAELADFGQKFAILHAAMNELGNHARQFGDQVGVLKGSVDHLEVLATADKRLHEKIGRKC